MCIAFVYNVLGKKFCKPSLQVEMDLKKVQKQGGDEATQEDYPIRNVDRKERQESYPATEKNTQHM